MARTKEFDPDTVLLRAVELFRERGYEATSMADLVERLGIARASLYATFGGKHDLYLAALGRYLEEREAGFVEALSKPGPVLPEVRALVGAWVEEALEDPERLGCLVVNAAVELAPHDPEVARRVEASWKVLETALASALLRARAQGELPRDKDPHAMAGFLLVMLQGIRVVGRAAPKSGYLRSAAAQALEVLEQETAS